MPCLQVSLMFGVAIMNSIAACIQEWPKAYQIINIPHFLMYIAIVYYLCKKEFYTLAWVVFALITLVTVDFIILSKKIFAMEHTVMSRLRGRGSAMGSAPSTPPGSASTPPGNAYARQPQASQQISQFTSQPSTAYTLEPGQVIRSQLEADGMQYRGNQPPINTATINYPANSDTVRVKL
jgi:hypothetical protein